MNVLTPGTTANSGQTATYFYEERGNFQLEGLENYVDFATEATWRIAGTHQAGFKAEIFNLTNNQEKTINNNVAWCGTTATRPARPRSTTSARPARAVRSCCRVATASR